MKKNNSNMMSFIGYINNTIIKLTIYINLHMHRRSNYKHHSLVNACIHTGAMHTNIKMPVLFLPLFFFQNKYLNPRRIGDRLE
jgi:hypothetical protein